MCLKSVSDLYLRWTWALNTCGALCLGLFQINSVLFTSCSVMEKKTSMKLLTSGAGLPLCAEETYFLL
ncbi:unnamed protein product [Schistosoma haematobium]|nr:unnamed protein product [Schistosoma haematobium]